MIPSSTFGTFARILAAGYALVLGVAIIAGAVLSYGGAEQDFSNAVNMPLSLPIAICLVAAGIMLFLRVNFGRLLFLVVAPWGSLALGSVFSRTLWQDDIPYTALAIFAYVPLVFLLSRGSVLRSLKRKDGKWVRRGGALLLVCAIVMFAARFIVVSSKPGSGGGLLGSIQGMNSYVQRLVMCDVPLWNYVIAFIGVSIPTRFNPKGKKAHEDTIEPSVPTDDDAESDNALHA